MGKLVNIKSEKLYILEENTFGTHFANKKVEAVELRCPVFQTIKGSLVVKKSRIDLGTCY